MSLDCALGKCLSTLNRTNKRTNNPAYSSKAKLDMLIDVIKTDERVRKMLKNESD